MKGDDGKKKKYIEPLSSSE